MIKQGVAYYPDYIFSDELALDAHGEVRPVTLKERVELDLDRMVRCGISIIRIGEFSWSTIQPDVDRWDVAVFRLVLDVALARKIEVILCTPTACPPKWLIDAHPDILPLDVRGQQLNFGSRRHYDPTNIHFREASRNVVTKFARAMGRHPAVKGWQVDNELGHHGTASLYTESARSAFQAWLPKHYESIKELNRAWFTPFWSQGYRSFAEVELPKATLADINPHLMMDYRRFCTDAYAEFMHEQVAILRQHSPDRLITHNFNSSPFAYDLCPWVLSESLDVAGFDHYQEEYDPSPNRSLTNFRYLASLKKRPFWVLEQQPLQVNWQAVNRRFEYDWLFLWVLQSWICGAEAMLYFSWQRFLGGPEAYHDSIIGHDVRNPETWQEKMLSQIKDLPSLLAEYSLGDAPPNILKDVLIVHDTESYWAHSICSQSTLYTAIKEMDRGTSLCAALGLGVHFTPNIPELSELNKFKAIFLPGYAFEFSPAESATLKSFVENGGIVVTWPRTAVKTRDNRMSQRPQRFYQEDSWYMEDFGALGSEELVEITLDGNTSDLTGRLWIEKVKILDSTWEAVGTFSNDMYAGAPAFLKKSFGSAKGMHLHCCTIPEVNQNFCEWFRYFTGIGNEPPILVAEAQYAAEVQIIPSDKGTFILNFTHRELPLAHPISGRFSLQYIDHKVVKTANAEFQVLPNRSIVCLP